jgi:hypothetical protein
MVLDKNANIRRKLAKSPKIVFLILKAVKKARENKSSHGRLKNCFYVEQRFWATYKLFLENYSKSFGDLQPG